MLETVTDRVVRKYRDRLSELGGQVGQRNSRLLGVVTLGVLSGLSDERILAEVQAASGTPPLTTEEVTHAISTARRDTVPIRENKQGWSRPAKRPAPLGARARDFVPRMICRGEGATFETLQAESPVAIPESPADQTGVYLGTLYGSDELLFCGDRETPGIIGRSIKKAGAWSEWLACAPSRIRNTMATLGVELPDTAAGSVLVRGPELHIANALTGAEGRTKEGKPSYRCGACIASHKFALVEFDDMGIGEQCAFWAGVILSGTLPLRSLVFSGNKSIHALVEVSAADGEGWTRALEKLLFATSHPEAPKAYQSDRSCKNPDRLPRLAGARRASTGKTQSLLWLSREALQPTPYRFGEKDPDAKRAKAQIVAVSQGVDKVTPRCRDCWNWTPNGIKHGCAAGVAGRPSPDFRGPCSGFQEVTI